MSAPVVYNGAIQARTAADETDAAMSPAFITQVSKSAPSVPAPVVQTSSSGKSLSNALSSCFKKSTAAPAPQQAAAPTRKVYISGQPFVLPAQEPKYAGRKTLVLDLDETLVHSSFKPVPNPDYILPVEVEGFVHQIYVHKRPGCDEFLAAVGQIYEVVIFTASLSKYADPLITMLDATKTIAGRLFREHCTNHHGSYVKDMSRLGRDLAATIIIDNSPTSYLFHPENAIPCTSWFDDFEDRELFDLIPYLTALEKVPDVREILDPEQDEEY